MSIQHYYNPLITSKRLFLWPLQYPDILNAMLWQSGHGCNGAHGKIDLVGQGRKTGRNNNTLGVVLRKETSKAEEYEEMAISLGELPVVGKEQACTQHTLSSQE